MRVVVDPEFKKELEESRKAMSNPGGMGTNPAANFDLAGFLSGASAPAQSVQVSAPAKQGGKGGKRR